MKKILFKDYLVSGKLDHYALYVKARSVFNLSPDTAHFFVIFAVRNNHQFLDELSLQHFCISRKNSASVENEQDREVAILEHNRYLYECGLI
jgi:hypothetical protein